MIPKTNMALGQLLAGTALLLAGRPTAGRARSLAGTVCALIVLALGALTLSEHLFNCDMGLDQLLAGEAPGAAGTASPNRMGPPGSLSLALLGAGLLALAWGRGAMAPYLGLAVCALNLFPAVGFLYGIGLFYSQPHLTAITWPTMTAMLAVGLGLVLARGESGPAAMLLRDDPGGALLRRLLPAALLAPLALGLLRIEGERQGLYDTATGTGGFVTVVVLLLSALMVGAAQGLSRADAARREVERQLRNQTELMDQAGEALIVSELGGVILSWNRGAEALYGWRAGDALGQGLHVFLRTEGVDVAEMDAQLERTGRWEGELIHTTREGRRVTVEARLTASRALDGRMLILESNRDITERKRAEEALRELTQRLTYHVDQSPLAVIEWGPDMRLVRWSGAAERVFGWRAEEVLGKRMEDFRWVYPEDEPQVAEVSADLQSGANRRRFSTNRNYRKDGSVVHCEWYNSSLVDGSGNLRSILSLVLDVTERRKAEEALAADLAATTRLQQVGARFVRAGQLADVLGEIVDAAIAITHADMGNIQLFDPQTSCLQIAASRGFEQPFLDFWNSVAEGRGSCGTAMRNAQRVIVEDVAQSPIFAGTPALEIQLGAGVRAIQSTPLIGHSGTFVGMLSTHWHVARRPDQRDLHLLDLLAQQAVDIIERARAEEALRESERRERERAEELAVVFEAVPIPVFIARDPDCLHLTGNRLADEMLRIPRGHELSMSGPEETKPRHFRALKDGRELRLDELPAQRAARGAQVKDFEFTLAFDDGMVRHVLGYGTPLLDDAGRPRGTVAALVDISERKRAEERIQASLREKEVLLKEIHHRVKNNLQVIASLVDIQANTLEDAGLRGLFQNVRDRVRSMALAHEKLYQSGSLARVEFADYTRSLLSYLARAHGSRETRVGLKLDLQPVALSVVTAVPCGLIVNELVTNAFKHAFCGRAKGEVATTLRTGPDGRVWLRVSDDGVGLPAGLDWRQSRSLGLRLIHLLAGQLNATVEVKVRAGGGTDFLITFAQSQPGQSGESKHA